MCFFDSPIGRCEAVREMVLLDETQRECACEHGCPPGFKCPLDGCFATVSGVSEEMAGELAARAAHEVVIRAAHKELRESVAA